MITYNNIIGRFEEFVTAHLMLKTFTHGSPSGVDLEKFEVYPALHVVYTGSTYENTSKEYSFEVYILDLPPDKAKKVENQTQLVSNAEQVAEDILSDMMNGGRVFDFGHLYTVSNASTTPLEETTSNSLAGILLSISIEVGFTLDSCNAPLIGVTPSGSGFPAASPSGLLEVRTQDGNPTATKVTTIIVSNGTLVDNGNGVVTIDTDIPTNVYLPLTGGTLTGDLNVDADLTVTGEITADSNFISSDSILVAATTGAGSILLRPNGKTQNAGQVILDQAGKVTTSGEAQLGGKLDMSTSKITNLLAGTNNLDAVNYQQFSNAIVGGLTYLGVWNANTNQPPLASSVGLKGGYYIINVTGATNLNGITDWVVGDWALFASTSVWQKVDNTSVIEGTGTGGTISKWGGAGTSATLTDSIITDDGTQITVDGNINFGDGHFLGDDADDNLFLSASAGENIIIATADSDIYFRKAATSLVAIKSSGNVGIGTTSPSTLLHIKNGVTRLEGSGDKQLQFFGSGKKTFSIEHDSSRIYFYNETDNNYPLTILNNGNVGISTSNPTQALEVVGTIKVVKTSAGVATGLTMFNNTAGANHRVAIDFNTNSTKYATIEGGYGSSEPELNFLVGNTPTQKLTIKNSGNVGIGTTSPSDTLTIYNDNNLLLGLDAPAGNDAQLRFYSAGAYKSIIYRPANSDDLRINVVSGDALTIKQGGNVGIGTTSPASKLSVGGGDLEVQSLGSGVILKSPDGTRYRLTVANGGALSVAAV